MTCTYTDLPKLGFGFMRLPEVEGADGAKEIDLGTLCDMVDTFMDAGFTYFDTARGYHGGRSEAALREALVKRYRRASFQVATKLPAWLAKDAGQARATFDTSLEQTGAGYFDFYLLHNLGEQRTHLFEDWGLWEFLAEKKAAGLIRNLGFSMHDKADALEDVLAAHPEVDFVQLQINYADGERDHRVARLLRGCARPRAARRGDGAHQGWIAGEAARGGCRRAARGGRERALGVVGAALRRVAAWRAHGAFGHVDA